MKYPDFSWWLCKTKLKNEKTWCSDRVLLRKNGEWWISKCNSVHSSIAVKPVCRMVQAK